MRTIKVSFHSVMIMHVGAILAPKRLLQKFCNVVSIGPQSLRIVMYFV